MTRSITKQEPLPLPLLTLLCSILLFAALGPIVHEYHARQFDAHPEWKEAELALVDSTPLLAGFRNEEGVPFVFTRVGHSPFHYMGAHLIPGALWCLLMPLQHIDTLRRRYPSFHRWCGRLALLCNGVLIISGLLLAPRKLSYTHPNPLHVHAGWLPTTEAGTTILGVVQGVLLWKTWRTARSRQYVRHRDWARLFTWAGLAIALQRVFSFVAVLAGTALAALPDLRARVMRVPSLADRQGVYEVELAAFAWTVWTAMITAGVGACWRAGKIAQVVKEK